MGVGGRARGAGSVRRRRAGAGRRGLGAGRREPGRRRAGQDAGGRVPWAGCGRAGPTAWPAMKTLGARGRALGAGCETPGPGVGGRGRGTGGENPRRTGQPDGVGGRRQRPDSLTPVRPPIYTWDYL